MSQYLHTSENLPPASASLGGGLAVPPAAGQGEGSCNRAAWMSVADFLTIQNLRAVLSARAAAADAKRSADAAAAGAGLLAVPDGNHGENLQ